MDEMMVARLERYGIPRPPAAPEPWRIPEEPEHLSIVLDKGGFRENRVVRETAGYFITPEEWWQFVWATSWRKRLSRLPAGSLEQFRQETLEEVGQLRADKGIRFNASALIGIGLR